MTHPNIMTNPMEALLWQRQVRIDAHIAGAVVAVLLFHANKQLGRANRGARQFHSV
jgi:hypothetical protein